MHAHGQVCGTFASAAEGEKLQEWMTSDGVEYINNQIFKVALGDVQWLVICYVLVYGSLMLVCGKLGDLFGHRLVFRIGLAISAVGCAACAAARTAPSSL